MRSKIRMAPRRALMTLAVTLLLVTAAPASPASATVERFAGTLPGGATWITDVPARWNGTLLLYGHGYRPPGVDNPPVNAPDPDTAEALLRRGYALAGSSYASSGWTVATAVDDQLGTLDAVAAEIGRPRRTIALGTSMGGLVTALLAERGAGRVDGALLWCGLLGGGTNLLDHQLDGAHALARLLGVKVPLAGFTDAAEAVSAANVLVAAVDAAEETPDGRASIALAAGLFHLPDVSWLERTLPFVIPARADIESRAGGNPSANRGVDYVKLFRRADTRHEVRRLYREAGLDLTADLRELSRTGDVGADPVARRWSRENTDPTGAIGMPVLTVHTTADNLAPVQFVDAYTDRVRRRNLLRTAFVGRTGHCAFTPAENVAAVEAIADRAATGRWGSETTPYALNAAADATGLGASDYIRFRVPEFIADDVPRFP